MKGEGNQQDYGMRIYDPRLGKFLSVDPLSRNFPWWTPYAFAGNTPIQAIDLDGGEIKKVVHYLDQHADGTRFVVKTDVEINKEGFVIASVFGQKLKLAKTTVDYVFQNQYYSGDVLYEPILEGYMKPSAAYDYSNSGAIEGKREDDIDYYINGDNGWLGSRVKDIIDRDSKAPDNAIIVQDLDDLKNVLARNRPGSQNKRDLSSAAKIDHTIKLEAPRGWTSKPSKKGGGTVYQDPSNPHNSMRVMPGNPNSPNSAQQNPYVIFKRNGKAYNKDGQPLSSADDPAAHIPANQFDLSKMPR